MSIDYNVKFFDENGNLHPFTQIFNHTQAIFDKFEENYDGGFFMCKNCGYRMTDIYTNTGRFLKNLESHECKV